MSRKPLAARFAVLLSACFLAAACQQAGHGPQTGRGERAVPDTTVPPIPEPVFPDRTLSVRDFGATGGGEVNDTPAINKAIAACAKAGGGRVFFPAGTYLAASIHLRSNVQLSLDPKAIITGAKDGFDPPEPNPFEAYQDFGHSHFHNALMWGENLENVAITGGTINGGFITATDAKPGAGDKVIAIRSGKNLRFKGITHQSGGHFVYLLNDCQNVTLEGITVQRSRDAVDLMGCRNVRVHGCTFTGCGDDTLGIKSDYALGRKIRSENIYAWDCYFETGCNGIQFGSETAGDFANIKAWDIRIGKAAKAGIGITCNDGGIIDGVEFRNITMRQVTHPIFMIVTDRLRTPEKDAKAGAIRNVTIRRVTASEIVPSRWGPWGPCTLSGLPVSPLENITLEDLKITYPGGGTAEQAALRPPYNKMYQPRGLGVRPASAFFVRHVKGLTLRRVEVNFEAEDLRPPLVLWDVRGAILDRLRVAHAAGVDMLRTQEVSGLQVRACSGLPDTR